MKTLQTAMAVGIALNATTAMADQSDAVERNPNGVAIQTVPDTDMDIYVLEQSYFQATGANKQVRGIIDRTGGFRCLWEISGTHKIGITNEPTTLHGVEMPEAASYTDTSDLRTILTCERDYKVPNSWLDGEKQTGPITKLLDIFEMTVTETTPNLTRLDVFIQRSENGVSQTVYTRDTNIRDYTEWRNGGEPHACVSMSEMVNPNSGEVDFVFVDGELVDDSDLNEDGYATLARAEFCF